MKNSLLIPNKCKVIGWFITVIAACFFIAPSVLKWEPPKIAFDYLDNFNWHGNAWDTIVTSFFILGLMMIAFSKEKQEDEYISFIRLKSWQWAIVTSYAVLFLGNILIFGFWALTFLMFNALTALIVFIIIFYWHLYKLSREGDQDEK